MVSYKDNLYKLLLVRVIDAPTIPVSADSSEGNYGDAIDIVMGRLFEAFMSICKRVPIKEEMSSLRFMMGMAEAENASLRGNINTMKAIETVTRSQERRARIEMEQQLASVQESQ
ncbi:hypothetical protein Tco_0339150 [Tanacetum coccineum]